MTDTENEQFDALIFINDLIEEMGLQNDVPEKLKRLKEAMLKALTRQVFQAAEAAVEPEVVDAVMEELAEEEDPGLIVRELLHASPGAQLAMMEALQEFRVTTLEAYNKLKS